MEECPYRFYFSVQESSPTKAYLSRFLLFICSVAVNTPGYWQVKSRTFLFLVCRCEIYSNPLYRKLKTGIFIAPAPVLLIPLQQYLQAHHVKWRIPLLMSVSTITTYPSIPSSHRFYFWEHPSPTFQNFIQISPHNYTTTCTNSTSFLKSVLFIF